MKPFHTSWLASILMGVLCLTTRGGAQTTLHSDGPLVGLPAMFGVDADTALLDADHAGQGYLKRTGFHGTPAQVLAGLGLPDFRANALFRQCAGSVKIPKQSPVPEIDAISLGLDVLPLTSGGVVQVPFQHWSGSVFSVTKTTQGHLNNANGRRIRAEAAPARPGGIGADLFGYVFRGAFCVPDSEKARTHRIADSTEIALPSTPLSEVDGVDVYAALYVQGIALEVGLPPNPTLYFSVRGDNVNLTRVPAQWWGTLPISGATIFRAQWLGTQWSCPQAVLSPQMLGLQACEDVDALAYDGQCRVVFSTVRPAAKSCPNRPPLMFTWLCGPLARAAAIEVTYADNTAVSTDAGLDSMQQTDDFDAYCVVDPSWIERSGGRSIRLYERAIASPQPLQSMFGILDGQAFPGTAARGIRPYEHWMVGGPAGGVWVISYLHAPTGTLIPAVASGAIASRGFEGVPVGPIKLGLPILAGVRSIDTIWLAFDTRLRLWFSHSLRLNLP